MDLKSKRNLDFNKRVRDLVSKDRTKLRERCDKFDKQCAERLAEIQHMQEKVRFSMRNLAKDKIQINQGEARRRKSEISQYSPRKESESSSSLSKDDESVCKKETIKEFLQKHRGSDGVLRSKNLEIPDCKTRRASIGVPPGSPKTSRDVASLHAIDSRAALSSSFPKDLYTVTNTRKLSRPNDRNNMLSVNDLRMTSKSPVINLRRKSADENVRGTRKFSEISRPNIDPSPDRLGTDNRPWRPRSVSVAHVTVPKVTKGTNSRKYSGAGPKGQLFRMRSSSLPDLLSPNYSNEGKDTMSSSAPGKRLEDTASGNITIKDNDSPLARKFEELRNCRYLRTSDANAD